VKRTIKKSVTQKSKQIAEKYSANDFVISSVSSLTKRYSLWPHQQVLSSG